MSRSHHKSGFSLIELLASIALLVIVTLLLTRIFSASSMAWRNGNKRIESNNNGRAAIDFMAREMAGMLVGLEYPTMKLESDADNFLGRESDRISFVSLNHVAEYRSGVFRDVQQIQYRVVPTFGYTNRYSLVRIVEENFDFGSEFTSYGDPTWYDNMYSTANSYDSGILAENVRSFEVFVTLTNGVIEDSYDSADMATKGPPAAIDIYVEVLADDDANKASDMTGNTTWIAAQTRRYATRVYIENRAGYAVP